MIVDRYGVSGIEPLDEHFASTDVDYLTKFRNALGQAKAHIVNIPAGLGGSLYDPDKAKRTKAINRAMHWIDVATFLGSPSVRPHLQGTKRVKTNVRVAAESLRILGEYGARKNVVVHLENDSPTTEDAFLLTDVIGKANTPWVRALPDFGNSMAAQKGAGYNYRAVTEMFRNAYGICHVKDSLQDGKSLFHVDPSQMFQIAKDANYSGYFSMEYDSTGDPYESTQHLIDSTLKALAPYPGQTAFRTSSDNLLS